MPFRVRDVLLVGLPYETFALAEGCRPEPTARLDAAAPALPSLPAPRVHRTTDGAQALAALASLRPDMLVATAGLAGDATGGLCRSVRSGHPGVPIGVIATDARQVRVIDGLVAAGDAECALLWQGDPHTLPALVRLHEDRVNAERGLAAGRGSALLLVEDDTRFLSFVLPRLSLELSRRSSAPGILLARSFEEAVALWERFGVRVAALLSDVAYPRAGALDRLAGPTLARQLLAQRASLPVLLESSDPLPPSAVPDGVTALAKESPRLTLELRQWLSSAFGPPQQTDLDAPATSPPGAGSAVAGGPVTPDDVGRDGWGVVGTGSVGGKGRGLEFLGQLLAGDDPGSPEVCVVVPPTLAVASGVFDEYLAANGLDELLSHLDGMTDGEVLDRFRAGRFAEAVCERLARFLGSCREPLAVRSSGLLEDVPYQPAAGVYATVLLPNNHPDPEVRLDQLLAAIQVVYASTFLSAARAFFAATGRRCESEHMAVLLQPLVGRAHGRRFYPTFSGLASSHNFYPFKDMRTEDGLALVTAGFGKTVEEGLETLRFCPAHPRVLPQLSSTQDTLRNAQRRFWALDLTVTDETPDLPWDANVMSLDIGEAFADGVAPALASTFLADDDMVVDRHVPGGVPLVTFAPLLRGGAMPLPALLQKLLEAVRRASGCPVEVVLATDLRPGEPRQTLSLLQLRPLAPDASLAPLEEALEGGTVVVSSPLALGHGHTGAISDIVVVTHALERARTREVAAELGKLDAALRREDRPYVLIGPGRWGSSDPWLGIPIHYRQIAGACAIVETDFDDLDTEPSQGSHFFQELTAAGVAFLSVHRLGSTGSIAWGWLSEQVVAHRACGGKVCHLRLASPVEVVVDGWRRRGAVIAPRQPSVPREDT
jgi:hypothetical protein